MALLCCSPHLSNPSFRKRTSYRSCRSRTIPNFYNPRNLSPVFLPFRKTRGPSRSIISCQLCTSETITQERSTLDIAEAVSEEELWAAACLRIRSFHEFQQCYGIEFSAKGEDRVVVGSLDLNQCLRLPDEITGKKPEGIGSDFARAYLSNVCVAKELHRNGVGSALVAKAKRVAVEWGITDLYVHVAVNNEPAKALYMKSGFIYENDEPAWQARFLDRPRRILLWIGLPSSDNL